MKPIKTPSGTWKVVIRKSGWPTAVKTFRLKKDAEDWERQTTDEMVRGVFIKRSPSERTTFEYAMKRYLSEVTPLKKASTQKTERNRSIILLKYFGKYSLAAITPELIANFRDERLAGLDRLKDGKPQPRMPNTVRLDLALIGHIFTIAVKEWGLGMAMNPILNIRRPSPGAGRNRRLSPDEEERLMAAVKHHSNPMLGWIVCIAVETSMRSTEISSLRRSQVLLERRIVRLDDTKNSSSRTVPLSPAATNCFRLALVNPVRPIDTDLIFFGEPGRDKKRRPYNFNKVWANIKKDVGIEDFRFHDLRHEAVSRFVESGLFSDQEVAAISGHKSMQMLRRYTHLKAEDLVERMDKIKKPA
ncbi:MAG: site-specific integrase [Bdellovibrionaceae bacterium]|nr:site-specific integrase [Pseudobdellovibrionaceae bacterium]